MNFFLFLFFFTSPLLFAKDEIPKNILDEYDSIHSQEEDKFLVVTKDSRFGYLDENYKEIIPCIYDYVNHFREEIATVKLEGKWGAINPKGELVIPVVYERIFRFEDNEAVALFKGKRGIINRENKVLVDFKYDDLSYERKEGLRFVSQSGKYGFIDTSGNLVIPLIYDAASDFHKGSAVVRKGNENFIIDKQNQITKELKYNTVGIRFHNRFFPVTLNGKYGLINHRGDETVQTLYDSIYHYLGDTVDKFKVSSNENYGFINENGRTAIPIIYEDLSFFSEGLIRAKANGKYGFLNETGKVIIPIIYDEANDYFSYLNENLSLAAIKLENDYFIFDNKGNKITSLKQRFDFVGEIGHQNLIPVKKNNKWGFINYKGEIKIPLQFEEVKDFWYGLAAVKIQGKWGFINAKGSFIIKPMYDEVEDFNFWEDLAKVKFDGKYGIINRKNKTVISFQYDAINSWQYESNFNVTKDGRSYKINYNEEEIKEAEVPKEKSYFFDWFFK